MGYRSEVAILLNDAAVKRMTDELKKTFDETFETVKTLDDGCVLYHTSSYKWYQGYEEVDAIEDFLAEISNNEEWAGCGAEFLRIGEDDDDNEHNDYGNWECWRLWLERSISLEGENI